MKKRLRPLALQATAAERAEKLGVEIAPAAGGDRDARPRAPRRAPRRGRGAPRDDAPRSAALLDEKIAALVAERERAEEELTDSAGAREQATAALYRLRSGGERIVLRRESAASLTRVASRRARGGARATTRRASVELEAAARDAADGRAGRRGRARAAAGRGRGALGARRRDRARARRPRSPPSSTRCSRAAPRPSRMLTGGGRDALLALRGAAQRLGVRHESAQRLLAELRGELAEARHAPAGPSPAELGRAADEADAAARTAAREREDLEARVALARERLTALEQSLAEREGLPPAARALAEEGEQLALQLLEVEAGRERSVAAALGHRASAVLADDPAARARARRAGAGRRARLACSCSSAAIRATLVELPVVARDALLASKVPAVTEGRDRLGPAARRAVVRRRDRRGGAARARRAPPRAARRGRAARRARRPRRRAPSTTPPSARARPPRRSRRSRTCATCAAPTRRGSSASSRGAERLDETLRVAAAAAAPARDAARRARGTARGGPARDRDARGRAAARGLRRRRARARGRAARERPHRRGDAATSPSCASRPKSSRRARPRPRRPPTTPPSAHAPPPARSPTPTRAARAARASSCSSGCSRGATRLEAALAVDVERFEAPVRERAEAQAARTTELGAALRRSAPRRSSCGSTRRSAGERLVGDRRRARAHRRRARRGAAAARRGATPSPPRATNRDELAEKLARYERRREQLGQVNPLAKEEYEAEKERLEELSVQRADLEKSLDELEKLRDDLTKTVETRFAETFAAVEQHFHEVAATLFPGGEGRLRLTEAEEEGEEPGIEVELRPAGKRVTRLSLLSGGEKALGAIAFLFSLFLARPSPFYLLDEVEAALDDTNIGRFTELLRTLRRPRAVHRDHAPEAHDGGRGRPLRRDDGHRRRLADRLAAPAARRGGRRDCMNDLAFVERAVDLLASQGVRHVGLRRLGRGAARADPAARARRPRPALSRARTGAIVDEL